MRVFIGIFIGFIALLLSSFSSHAQAETLVSPNYKIRMGNFNMTSGFKSSASYNLTDTVGQTVAEFFSSTGYSVKAGFQYMYTLDDFSFSISSISVNLGLMTPNSFSSASNTLTVSAPGQGYNVTTYETNKFTKSGGSETIDDTTCDSGPCTETSASPWTTASNNGFGYNASGNDVSTDFINSNYFRPFPDLSAAELPSTIMSRSTMGMNRVATITYKVSPSGSQTGGDYTTQIGYIATPVY